MTIEFTLKSNRERSIQNNTSILYYYGLAIIEDSYLNTTPSTLILKKGESKKFYHACLYFRSGQIQGCGKRTIFY